MHVQLAFTVSENYLQLQRLYWSRCIINYCTVALLISLIYVFYRIISWWEISHLHIADLRR